MAAAFRADRKIPFPLVVDQHRHSYQALAIGRGTMADVVGPKVWLRGAASILSGNRQGRPRQDPLQLGGATVIDAGGGIRLIHRATDAADNVPVRALIDALP